MTYVLRTYVKKKYLFYALCAVYGINESLAQQICAKFGFQKTFLTKNLSDKQIYSINKYVEEKEFLIKGDLHRWLKQKIDLLSSIKSYRGLRHRLGLPVRGQRTHTNAKTVKKLRRLRSRNLKKKK
jgi:small subunit ribosomal protein S13